MTRYTISKPLGYHNDFEGFLYNQSGFLKLKDGDIHSFYALNDLNKAVVAQAHFIICSNDNMESYHAISLPGSPFGSVEFSQNIEEESLFRFITFIKESLFKQQVTSIQIKECIPAYRHYGGALLLNILHQHHFMIQGVMPNHHIEVDVVPFEKKIHRMESKRLRKCVKSGFIFRQEPLTRIPDFYQFIQTCREEKGWSLSMTLDEIKRAVTALPEHYRIFAVYDQDICVAACFAVLVREQILYVYAQATLQEYHKYSPVVLLLSELYNYCREQNIKILDLGTSPSESLQAFKYHVGGTASEKLTLQCYKNSAQQWPGIQESQNNR